MAQQTPSGIVRQASTLSILWGVSLIILGMLAVGSPFLAAVAVNAFIAWLLVLAGVVHLTVAFHTREAGSLIWRVLVGLAYLFFGVYLIMHPALGVASLTLVLASLLLVEGILNIALFFPGALNTRIRLASDRWDHYAAIRTDDLHAMAIELRVGDRHTGRREHDHQRRYACDALIGGAQSRGHNFLEVGCLSVASV
jgi:hypothetical protein